MPLGPEHAPALYAVLRDPAIYEFIPHAPPRSVAELEARYRRIAAGSGDAAQWWWNWAVALRDRPTAPFGTVELSVASASARAVLGYVFATAAWGHGYAAESCRAGLAYLHANVQNAFVDAFIDTRNARSVALIERLGFARQETLSRADYFKGASSDEHRYRLAMKTSFTARSASRSSR